MAVTPPAFMTPHSIGGRGMAARVVREALDAVASPTVVTRVLHRAMHMARVSAIPEEGVELRRFVAHPLDAALRFVVGDEMLLIGLKPQPLVLGLEPRPPRLRVQRVRIGAIAGERGGAEEGHLF